MLKTFLNFSGVDLLSSEELKNIKGFGEAPYCERWAPPGSNRAYYPNYPCDNGPNEPICTATVDGVVCP